MKAFDDVMSTLPQGGSRQLVGPVPERLRHVFDFYGIPDLSQRLSAVPHLILQVLNALPGKAVRKPDLSSYVADRSGLSEVFPRNANLKGEYIAAFETALERLEQEGQVGTHGDLVVLREQPPAVVEQATPVTRPEPHSSRLNNEMRFAVERATPLVKPKLDASSDQESRGAAPHSRSQEEEVALAAHFTNLRTSFPAPNRSQEEQIAVPSEHRLPAIPELPDAILVEQPIITQATAPEPCDPETQTRLAILTGESADGVSPSKPSIPSPPPEAPSSSTDVLNRLKTVIEEDLGAQVQKRLDELSICGIVPGSSCHCTISLEADGMRLGFRATLPLIINCATELLEAAETERLSCSLGIATIYGDRMLVMRLSVDLRRYSPSEVLALGAKALREVIKISKILYDGERFREKPKRM